MSLANLLLWCLTYSYLFLSSDGKVTGGSVTSNNGAAAAANTPVPQTAIQLENLGERLGDAQDNPDHGLPDPISNEHDLLLVIIAVLDT